MYLRDLLLNILASYPMTVSSFKFMHIEQRLTQND